MKAFGEWNKDQGFTLHKDNPRQTLVFERERAWKAALKWLSDSCWCGGQEERNMWKECEFIAAIRKELEEL